MLKPQDCVLLIKLLANRREQWPQRQLAAQLCMSQSEINAGLRRLMEAELLRKQRKGPLPVPVLASAEEYLIHAVKYSFPAHLGEYTPGIPTGIAAPVFKGKVALGKEPLPVWPYAKGKVRGVALAPLYPSVPRSLDAYPDANFYDLLALVDIFRRGRARERRMAVQMLHERLRYE